jgi:Na+-driven multidrug efflux pump
MIFISAVSIPGARIMVSFFTNDPGVQDVAVQAMRIIGAGYMFYGVGMVLINAFNGAGDTWTPTWINLFGFWFFQIPLAYLLG